MFSFRSENRHADGNSFNFQFARIGKVLARNYYLHTEECYSIYTDEQVSLDILRTKPTFTAIRCIKLV